jgi:integrase
MHNKWLYFSERFGRNSADPTQADVNAYICWMATVGAWAQDRDDGVGTPMAYQSIKDYVDHLGRSLRAIQKGPVAGPVITESIQTHWALLSTKRLLGDAKQRARAITMDEIRLVCTKVQGSESFTLAFRVIVLLAWFGAFRLGQLLPHSNSKSVPTMRLADLVQADDKAVYVTSHRSKTNVFNARTRTIRIGGSTVKELCLATALEQLLAFRKRHRLPTDVSLAELDPGLATFEKLVKAMQALVRARDDTALEKGRITGHSFRRGFTKAALLAGYSLQAIMVHGDWNHVESVLNSYAVGAVLPSISLAPGSGNGNVATVAMAAAATTGGSRREASRPPFSNANPFSPSPALTDSLTREKLEERACKWEIQEGPLSLGNPWKKVGLLSPAVDEQREARARDWESKHSRFL